MLDRVSSQAEMDQALQVLAANKDAWPALDIAVKIAILAEIQHDLLAVADEWVAAGAEAKRVPPDSFGVGEEWAVLAGVLRLARLWHQSLNDVQTRGQPQIPGRLAMRGDGQIVARVFPQTYLDRALLIGVTGEVWFEPGLAAGEIHAAQMSRWSESGRAGAVVAVLGAGNVSVVPPADILHQLFGENRVVVFKFSPVNAYLGPLLERGFRSLIRRGFLRIVYGGAAEGEYLCRHAGVDAVHLTGSDKTFDAILYGSDGEGAQRKAAHARLLTKPISGELGSITPVIVVPGPWTADDLRYQAVQIATWLCANAGCNCMTPRVLITHKNWAQREPLLRVLGETLSRVPSRYAYYPGAHARYKAFTAAHPNALRYGADEDHRLPWTLIQDLDPNAREDICFRSESFCSVTAETALEADDIPDFVRRAVAFANNTLWGTLSALMIVHPSSLQDRRVAAAVEAATAELRYGTIGINIYPGYSYILMLSPWGAYPGGVEGDLGTVNNPLMLERVQKSVYRAPFRRPDPLTVFSKRTVEFGRKFALFQANPSLWQVPSLLWTAVRS